ncbi:MAG: hypothetical protein ACTHK6_01115 [Solirubrobacterales bacterium]
MSVSRQDASFDGGRQLHQVLSHGLRLKLLFDALEDGSTSSSRFVEKHGLGEGCLSPVTYHLKVLEKCNVLILRERIPIYGAIENAYQVKPAD